MATERVLVLRTIAAGRAGEIVDNVDGALDGHIASGNAKPVPSAVETPAVVDQAVEVDHSDDPVQRGGLRGLFGGSASDEDPED